MIIKVVELIENEQYTEYDDGAIVKKKSRYCLVENFLNVSKIVSFREVDRDRYYNKDMELPEGMIDGQSFTYISLAGNNRGVVAVDNPLSVQDKINCLSTGGQKQDILKG